MSLSLCPLRRASRWLTAVALVTAGLTGRAGTATPSAAEPTGDFLVNRWTTEQGLCNSSVTALAQTPDGYLWVGTYNGLARFDGSRFLTFDPFNSPGLRHARIRKLSLDDQGTLWVNTYDGSLTTLRGGEFRFEFLGAGRPDSSATLVSSRSNTVLFLLNSGELIRRAQGAGTNDWQTLRPASVVSGALAVEDGRGKVWYRGRDSRLCRLDGDTFTELPTNAVPGGARVNWLATGPGGALWVAGQGGLWTWDGRQFTDGTPTNEPPPSEVTFFHFTRGGALWCVADGRIRCAEGRQWVAEVEAWRGALAGVTTRISAVEDADGGLWIYHYGRGLFHLSRGGAARRPSATDGLPGDRVDACLCDREGNIWAGIDRGGLVRLRERSFRVTAVLDGASTRAIVSVCEDNRGTVWLGTFGGGLRRLSSQGLELVPLPAGVGQFVFSLAPDSQGRLWLSAGEEDLCLCEEGMVHTAAPSLHAVKSLLADRQGRLWVGTKSSLYRVVAGVSRRMIVDRSLYPTEVRALAEDADGSIWAGTSTGELLRFRGDEPEVFKPTDTLARSPVWALCATPDGAVWAGTFRGGLLQLREGRFTRLTQREGLPSDVVCQILDDTAGGLWLGTAQGIARLALADLEAVAEGRMKAPALAVYGLHDGLPTLECSGGYQPAAWRARDGRLWFATAKGAVSVQPAKVGTQAPPPPVVIEETRVEGRLREPAPTSQPGRGGRSTSAVPTLTLGPGERQVEFRFAALSLSAPDRVRFRHRLEGLEDDWIEAGGWRTAQYPYLRPGQYTFKVAAASGDGPWNPEAAAVKLQVEPRFHETWWFPTVVVAGMAIALGVVVRRVTALRLRRELQLLERQQAVERDRARIAKDIHDDLGAGLTQITLLSELARRDTPEEAPAHLAQISGTARELTRAMDEIVWAINPRNDMLDSLITYVSKFAQDYLGLARIRCRLDLPADVPALPLTTEVRHNLFLAVKEALNNVVKHAQASEVWLRVALAGEELTILIEDNGRGLSNSTAQAVGGRISSGHGLANLTQRLAAIAGECRVLPRPEGGTRVEFILRREAWRSPLMATPARDSQPAP